VPSQPAAASHKPPSSRSVSRSQSARPLNHGQSPLSLPQNNTVSTQASSIRPEVDPQTSASGAGPWSSPRKLGLRQVASSIQLRGHATPSGVAGSSVPRPLTHRSNSMDVGSAVADTQTNGQYPSSPLASSAVMSSNGLSHQQSLSSLKTATQSRTSVPGRQSGEMDASESRSVLTPPPLIRGSYSSGSQGHSRESSLRSKISMSALFSNANGPVTPADDKRFEVETVSVKDTDFQLIKPIRPVIANNSEDSLPLSNRESKPDPRFLRTDSPSVSMLSGKTSADPSSPLAEQFDGGSVSPAAESPTAAEAHRQRELRWVSLMSSTPAGQARKNKKIKKLLLEGVPASVRHLVWANLAHSKANRMDGFYARLVERGRVSASDDIERDARKYQNDSSPVATLLQAYLTMVPDIRYNTGKFFR
jgi:TBC1 domain family member 10